MEREKGISKEHSLRILSKREQKIVINSWEAVSDVLGVNTRPKLVLGTKNIPKDSPHIVVCNHRGMMEAPALIHAWSRWIYIMAKSETFDMKVISDICEYAGAFPVKRGSPDRAALRTSLDYLKKGKVIGIMPEGTRGRESLKEYNEFKEGAAFVGILSKGVPIVPVGIVGTEKKEMFPLIDEMNKNEVIKQVAANAITSTRPRLIKVSIGKPITDYYRKLDRSEVTNQIFERIDEQIKILDQTDS